MKKLFLLASAALCIMASTAFADSQGVYGTLQGGLNFLPDLKTTSGGTTSSESIATGPSLGGAVGYSYGNGFRTEIDGLYSHSEIDQIGATPTSGHLDATTLTVNGLYDIDIGSPLTPYIGAGVGFTDVSENIENAGNSQWVPMYQLRAGASYNLSSDVSAMLEYRWQQSDNAKLVLAGDPTKQQFDNNGLILGLTYHMQ
jgi:OOP family OmpA-OmpF porin